MANPSYGTTGLIATTLNKYVPRLEDNVFGATVLLWILRHAGVIQNHDGGRNIVKPLIYAGASNVGSYSGDDVFSTNANTGISAAEFPWRQFFGLVSFEGIELAQNSGGPALLNLMKSRMQQVELTMADSLNQMLWGDGSGNSGKDFMGLAGIISASDPSVGDLGGIDRATYAYWKATTKASSTPNTLVVTDMANVYNTASKGADEPTNIVTTQTAYEAYEAGLTDQIRYNDTEMADAGFQNLMFKGAPMAFDEDADVASTTEADAPVWFLNTKYLELAKLANVWFQPSELAQPVNQDAFYKHLKCYGNLVVSNCARQGVLYDVHA